MWSLPTLFDSEALRQHSEYPRQFLPADARLETWEDIEPHIKTLAERPVETRDQLERWILDLGELEAAIGEEYSLRSIRHSCHTDDPEAEARYLSYVQEVLPRTEPAFFQLQRKMLASPALDQLPDRYKVYIRGRRTDVKNFREENVELQTQDAVLGSQYDKLCGEQTVEFDGRIQTLPMMNRYLEETDRGLRERAWRALVTRRAQDAPAMEDIFDKMIELRNTMARNAGFDSFIEFQFERYHRFDYTPDDCLRFHDAVEKIIVPLARKIQADRRDKLGVDRLCPWDLSVDPLGRPPIRPFSTADELLEGTSRVFEAVDPFFESQFQILRRHGLLDLESRKGKAPGGYQCTLDEVRLPFIFMNAAGQNSDVFTLIHEGGHAFHALAARDEPLHAYRSAPIEFCEVASMGMEMMAAEHLERFYTPEDAARARRTHLESVINLIPWIARVDAFQHWIYCNPGHSREERRAQWIALDQRFGEDLAWPKEFEDWRAVSWVSKLHFFRVPLYYVEYGIAQLGALQLWQNYRRNPAGAVADYRQGLSLGGSRPLPELFSAAGLRLTLTADGIAPLVSDIEAVLAA
jgi:oligoendopeptidase F